ncbi:MAG: glycosyltransferase [Deltaproteobacteria bacterium]|nr:glycosyltransferase [Deltaproteobacteria bacterium]
MIIGKRPDKKTIREKIKTVFILGITGDPYVADEILQAQSRFKILSLNPDVEPNEFTCYVKNFFVLLLKILRINPERIIILQNTPQSRCFLSLFFFKKRCLLIDDELIKLDIKSALKRKYESVRRLLYRVYRIHKDPPHTYTKGLNNDYAFIEKKKKQLGDTWYKKKASVIVPVYNRSDYLRKTLAGLTLQTYPSHLLEVIVGDDGSSENIASVIDEFRSELRCKLVRQSDQGYRLAEIRNKAMANACGDVILSLDCDCIPEPGYVEKIMKWFHATEENIVVTGNRKFFDCRNIDAGEIKKDFRVIRKARRVKPHAEVASKSILFKLPFLNKLDWRIEPFLKTKKFKRSNYPYTFALGGVSAYHRNFANDIGGYCTRFRKWGGEDLEFAYRMYKEGAYFIPDFSVSVYHQDHECSRSRSDDRLETLSLLGQLVPLYRRHAKGKKYQLPKVSIYIPAYNAEKTIKRAVDSCLVQHYRDLLEVVVVDDGSSDNTWEILKENYENNPRVQIFRQEHGGIGSASNKAVTECRGEYVGQLDSDDFLEPSAVQALANQLDLYPQVGLFFSNYRRLFEDGSSIIHKTRRFSVDELMHGCNVTHFRMFRKTVWRRTEGFSDKIINAVDYDMMLKLSEVAKIGHYPKVLYNYCFHSKNTSTKNHREQYKNHIRAIEWALERRKLRWGYRKLGENSRKVEFFRLKHRFRTNETPARDIS